MTKAAYMRKRRELLAQLADLDAQPIDEPKPAQTPTRRRVPTWCKPWWERRDGRQHIVSIAQPHGAGTTKDPKQGIGCG